MLEGAGFPKGGNTVVLGGATIAGFFAAACSLPFDFVKTRIQKMEPGPDGKFPYKGPVDCAMKTLTQEGPLKFYTGFPTYCVRCAAARPSLLRCVGCCYNKGHGSALRMLGLCVHTLRSVTASCSRPWRVSAGLKPGSHCQVTLCANCST